MKPCLNRGAGIAHSVARLSHTVQWHAQSGARVPPMLVCVEV